MHICIISSYFPQHCGIASYTHYLARALKSSDESLKLTVITEKSNQEMYSVPFNIFPAFNRDEDYSSQLTLQLKNFNPDIVHIQHEYGVFGYDVLLKAADLGKRYNLQETLMAAQNQLLNIKI